VNIDKTKLLTPDPTTLRRTNVYIYLGHTTTLGKGNQTRRIRLTWAAVGRLGTTLRNPTLDRNPTMTLTVKSANRLRTTQRAIERTMFW